MIKKVDNPQYPDIEAKREMAQLWFRQLRDNVRNTLMQLEREANSNASFEVEKWDYQGGSGGGEMSVMYGKVFEKVCVHISSLNGEFPESVADNIPGTAGDRSFAATGISLIAHPKSPLVPTVHMNTRFIVTQQAWFGGGADLTPTFPDKDDTATFHDYMRQACDAYNPSCYEDFKKRCDKYFFLPHRNEMRGVGGIFYDYLNSGDWDKDFGFTKEVGSKFLTAYTQIVRRNYKSKWTAEQKEQQLYKRGRYVEFNLLYDRGTQFGLQTGGNVKAILGSMPPEVKWE